MTTTTRIRGLAALVVLAAGAVAPVLRAQVSPGAEGLHRSAIESLRAGEIDRAMESYLRAYRTEPAILALDDEGLIDSVIQYLEGRLQSQGDDPELHFKLAEFLNLGGRLQEAVDHYEKVMGLSPAGQLAQTAEAEAAKLRSILTAQQSAQPASPPAGDDGSGEDGEEAGGEEGPPPVDPSMLLEAEARAKTLEGRIEKLSEDNQKLRDEVASLRKEYDEYKAQAEKWKHYHNLFFSNPANIELLRQGRVR